MISDSATIVRLEIQPSGRSVGRPAKKRWWMTAAVALALAAGMVLAAQQSGRADRFADPSDRELHPQWVPGSDVPMAVYLGANLAADAAVSPAPPR